MSIHSLCRHPSPFLLSYLYLTTSVLVLDTASNMFMEGSDTVSPTMFPTSLIVIVRGSNMLIFFKGFHLSKVFEVWMRHSIEGIVYFFSNSMSNASKPIASSFILSISPPQTPHYDLIRRLLFGWPHDCTLLFLTSPTISLQPSRSAAMRRRLVT